MKIVLVLVVFVALAAGSRIPTKERLIFPQDKVERIKNHLQRLDTRDLTIDIDETVDEIIPQVSSFLLSNGLDPYDLNEIHKSFSHKVLLITYHGELDLTNGWLQDIATLKRGGESNVVIGDTIKVTIPLAFDDLKFEYDYSAKIMSLGPTGVVDGSVENIKILVSVDLDLSTYHITLDTFDIYDAGKIHVKFSENYALLDWLANILTELVTTVLHDLVISIADKVVIGEVNKVIDQINDMLGG